MVLFGRKGKEGKGERRVEEDRRSKIKERKENAVS